LDPSPDPKPTPKRAAEFAWGFHGPVRRNLWSMAIPTVELKPSVRDAPVEVGAPVLVTPMEAPRGGGRGTSSAANGQAASGVIRATAMEEIALEIRRLNPRATLPAYQTAGASGMDLAACLAEGESIRLAPGAIALVPTGLALAIPAGFEGQVRPRSGLATKFGVTVANAPGTIDSDYRGELKVALVNLGKGEFAVEHGMRVAQLVIAAVARARVVEVESLDQTPRGVGGFGSTGAYATG